MSLTIYQYVIKECAKRGLEMDDVTAIKDMKHLAARNGIIVKAFSAWGFSGAYEAGEMLNVSQESVNKIIKHAKADNKKSKWFDANRVPVGRVL